MRQRRPRDTQKSRVYRAEHAFREELGTRSHQAGQWEWERLTELARDSWTDYSGGLDMPRLVLNTRRRNWSVYFHGEHRIELAPSMRCPVVMLHELTHASMGIELGQGRVQPHGPEFVRRLVDRVDTKLGFDAGMAYRRALRQHRVRIAR